MNHDDVSGEIFISPNNYMTAKYKLYAVDESDLLTEIDIMVPGDSDTLTEISVRVEEDSSKETVIDVMYRGNSDIYTEIQPIGHNNIEAELYIRPNNRMWALYEVQEPPRLLDVLNPVQDSFTRENKQYQSINYGGNNSLTVGQTADDIYRSFIQFDFSNWNPAFVIIDSKLRIHYSGTVPKDTKLELFTLNEQWTEYGITHLNRPHPVELIVDEFTNDTAGRYVEFEFTDMVVDWIKRNAQNYGFQIRLANEKDDALVTFRARESNRPPELLITYYDARVYSAGRSQIPTEIFVWNTGSSETLTEIEVGSVVDSNDVLTEIYVHRYEVPLFSEYDAEITVTKPMVYSEVTVAINEESDTLTEISTRVEGMPETVDTEINVSRPEVYTEIYVRYQDDIDTEITVQRNEESCRLTEISVTRDSTEAEIYVKHRVSTETEITVQKTPDEDIGTEITVSREAVPTEIYVKHRSDIYTEITVQGEDENIKDTEITVSKPSVWTEIAVRAIDEDTKGTEIAIRALEESDKLTEISVTRDAVLTEITIVETSDVDAEIYVKHRDDIYTELTVTVFDDVLTEIDVIQNSNTLAEIAVTRPEVLTEIMVPYWDDNDVFTEIEPRILQVSDVETVITVRTKGGAYAFII